MHALSFKWYKYGSTRQVLPPFSTRQAHVAQLHAVSTCCQSKTSQPQDATVTAQVLHCCCLLPTTGENTTCCCCRHPAAWHTACCCRNSTLAMALDDALFCLQTASQPACKTSCSTPCQHGLQPLGSAEHSLKCAQQLRTKSLLWDLGLGVYEPTVTDPQHHEPHPPHSPGNTLTTVAHGGFT